VSATVDLTRLARVVMAGAAATGVEALVSSPHVWRQSRVSVFGRLGTLRGRRPDPTPWAPLRRPLAECRLALVAGSVCLAHSGRRSDPGVPVGDPSLRTIAGDVLTAELLADARGRSDTKRRQSRPQPRLCPRSPARSVADGRLGELNRRHLALCGVMAATGRAIAKRAPRLLYG